MRDVERTTNVYLMRGETRLKSVGKNGRGPEITAHFVCPACADDEPDEETVIFIRADLARELGSRLREATTLGRPAKETAPADAHCGHDPDKIAEAAERGIEI